MKNYMSLDDKESNNIKNIIHSSDQNSELKDISSYNMKKINEMYKPLIEQDIET